MQLTFSSAERPNGINGTGKAKGKKAFPTKIKELLSSLRLSCWKATSSASLGRRAFHIINK